jgi:hypothetical protein
MHIVSDTKAGTGREEERVATAPDILNTAVTGQFASHLRYRANCVAKQYRDKKSSQVNLSKFLHKRLLPS